MLCNTRDDFSNEIDQIANLDDAIKFLETLSRTLSQIAIENDDTERFVSAMSGFLEEFDDSTAMDRQELRRLCAIVLESLFYE